MLLTVSSMAEQVAAVFWRMVRSPVPQTLLCAALLAYPCNNSSCG